MQAIEFLTQAEDGIIKIPKKHIKNFNRKIRVIILAEEEPAKKKSIKKGHFSAIKIKTKGFKFNREEAKER